MKRDDEFFESVKRGLEQAAAWARGEGDEVVVHRPRRMVVEGSLSVKMDKVEAKKTASGRAKTKRLVGQG